MKIQCLRPWYCEHEVVNSGERRLQCCFSIVHFSENWEREADWSPNFECAPSPESTSTPRFSQALKTTLVVHRCDLLNRTHSQRVHVYLDLEAEISRRHVDDYTKLQIVAATTAWISLFTNLKLFYAQPGFTRKNLSFTMFETIFTLCCHNSFLWSTRRATHRMDVFRPFSTWYETYSRSVISTIAF